jgi:hypothetical protein
VAGGAALAALTGVTLAGQAWGVGRTPVQLDDLRTAAREAWLYGVPLIELARLRAAAIGASPAAGTPGFNAFAHARQPAGPGLQGFSAPEADVLYSSAWIDLSSGAARVYAPPTGGRYLCLTISDMYGNVIACCDNTDAARDGWEITVVGPPPRVGVAGYTAPMPRMPTLGGRQVRAPGPWVWALARIQFVGEADLTNAHALQDNLDIKVKPPSRRVAPAPALSRDAGWSDYFYAVQQLIDENPPPPAEQGFFRRIAPIQVGANGGFERARFADPDIDDILAGVRDAQVLVSQPRAAPSDGGWVYPQSDLGDFGMDILYRAQSVLSQPGAPPPARITTLRAAGPDGALTFPAAGYYHLDLAEPPPADSFWTVTLYDALPDGRLALPDTGRHELGDRSAGLGRRPDGGVDLWLGHSDPGGQRSDNWLPTTGSGQFALLLRAYAPKGALTERRYRAPPLEAMSQAPGRQQ